MFEYQNNNYENRNQMYDYYQMPETGGPASNRPSGPKKTGKAGKLVKKIGAITLSAALFGSVAAGSFQAVNTLIGPTETSDNTAAAENTSASLLKAAAIPGAASEKGSLDVSDIAETVMPSIVSITNKSVQEIQNYFSMFGYGGQTIPQETESRGSGIIIGKNDTELLIVTNNHVIENADTLSAGFIDNQVYEANVKGTDPANDLAVIAVPLESISADTMSQIAVASIGDSDSLKVGEQVVAIGNALGYGQSVTTGIVSATNRTMGSNTQVVNTSADVSALPTYIQTDAAINPGNSGGALLNMKGELVGINAAKYASTEVEGIGYAIPISKSEDIINQLMTRKSRTSVPEEERGYLGIQGTNVDENAARTFGMPKGAYIYRILENGAAAASELREKDIITKVDGQTVRSMEGLQEILAGYRSGEQAELTVQRQVDGSYQELTVTVTLAGMPQEDQGR